MNPFSYAEYFLSITCLRVENSGAKKAAHQMVLYQDMWIVGAHTQALRKFRNRCVLRNLYPPDVRSSKEKVSNKLKIGYREAHFLLRIYRWGLFMWSVPPFYTHNAVRLFLFLWWQKGNFRTLLSMHLPADFLGRLVKYTMIVMSII